ncbi:MAG: polysaccharide pyruvyl transferase family protein [Bacteroidales bacterium]|nr:polysaccharide pyruvyl transferase family protein [Bacteroidales bacterium]MBD5228978.1 polysaccharide pyruvyl transferase family protein [Bacteroidales bacterium]
MKKVGIITMHRVFNMGSVLQAYATQECVKALGFDAEIIDYVYPNIEHQIYLNSSSTPKKIPSLPNRIFTRLKSKLVRQKSDSRAIRRQKFEKFMSEFYNLSPCRYTNRYLLCKTPPVYDIYLTGSDQVWNPNYIGYDTSFMLGFAREKSAIKVAYAPSISVNEIPEQFKEDYSTRLKEYTALSVREQQAVNIVEELSGKNVTRVCDPTLLLSREEWIERLSDMRDDDTDEKKYFVVFILNYKFNPYPGVFNIIEKAHREYGGEIIVIHGEISDYMKSQNARFIPTADPKDFIYYLSRARFMVTTSFHGTVFALNFSIPFICALDTADTDTRIPSLLADYGAERHGIPVDSVDIPSSITFDKGISQKISDLREHSKKYLKDALNCK